MRKTFRVLRSALKSCSLLCVTTNICLRVALDIVLLAQVCLGDTVDLGNLDIFLLQRRRSLFIMGSKSLAMPAPEYRQSDTLSLFSQLRVKTYQGAKNSTRMRGSLFTMETKLFGVSEITSEGSSSAATKPAVATSALRLKRVEKRIVCDVAAGKVCLSTERVFITTRRWTGGYVSPSITDNKSLQISITAVMIRPRQFFLRACKVRWHAFSVGICTLGLIRDTMQPARSIQKNKRNFNKECQHCVFKTEH